MVSSGFHEFEQALFHCQHFEWNRSPFQHLLLFCMNQSICDLNNLIFSSFCGNLSSKQLCQLQIWVDLCVSYHIPPSAFSVLPLCSPEPDHGAPVSFVLDKQCIHPTVYMYQMLYI